VVTNEKAAINENRKNRNVDGEQREKEKLMYKAEDAYRELSPGKRLTSLDLEAVQEIENGLLRTAHETCQIFLRASVASYA
jgi:hypothetical protein